MAVSMKEVRMKRLILAGLSTAVLLGGAACSNTVEGLKKDAEKNKVEEKTEKAAEVVASAVQEAGREVREKALVLDVKASLLADKRVDASHVHVKADDDARVLILTGSVPTAAQKEVAESIAKSKSGDYRVLNRLTAGRS
jgi:predicted small secreted protein